MGEIETVAEGLEFPEGPVALGDGSVVVVEIARGTITRVGPDGEKEVVAEPGDGPNGAAIGPDGKLYVCNNGGTFTWVDMGGVLAPGPFDPVAYRGGRIERVDVDTGEVDVLYDSCDGRPLRGPNDLVFDAHGGFWFTDHGIREERTSDRSPLYYARADGSDIREAVFPVDEPNGIGLSPDGSRLYAAETYTGRVWWWEITKPGEVAEVPGILPHGGTILRGMGGERFLQGLDSLAVDGEGWVCVGTLLNGGISSVSPDGGTVEFLETGDPFTTNICFGGEGYRTAYITLSGSGRLAKTQWPRPGLQLAYGR
ncbi:MAG: SMP-30/gluconolactonase/LRE family protein [Thermoleophilaceae bacterium]